MKEDNLQKSKPIDSVFFVEKMNMYRNKINILIFVCPVFLYKYMKSLRNVSIICLAIYMCEVIYIRKFYHCIVYRVYIGMKPLIHQSELGTYTKVAPFQEKSSFHFVVL